MLPGRESTTAESTKTEVRSAGEERQGETRHENPAQGKQEGIEQSLDRGQSHLPSQKCGHDGAQIGRKCFCVGAETAGKKEQQIKDRSAKSNGE